MPHSLIPADPTAGGPLRPASQPWSRALISRSRWRAFSQPRQMTPSGGDKRATSIPGREAAGALQGRCHRSPGQATPKAERRPGYSASIVRVPRPLWPQSAKLTGAKEAMELTSLSGVEVGGMPCIQYQRSSRVPSRVRLPMRRAPGSQPWCGLSARAVARGQQASARAPSILKPRSGKRPGGARSS